MINLPKNRDGNRKIKNGKPEKNKEIC